MASHGSLVGTVCDTKAQHARSARYGITEDHKGQKGRSDRTYYRLRCVSLSASTHEDLTCDLYCDIYFEAVSGVWILERVYD